MSAGRTQEGGTHYVDMPIQPWDVIDTWPLEHAHWVLPGLAIKYLMRNGPQERKRRRSPRAVIVWPS